VAKNLERIADHATNMAETIVFLVSGQRVVAERPKADTTATFINTGANTGKGGV
jgi:phosphate transport system protein